MARVPPAQYVDAEHVLGEMANHGLRRLHVLSVPQVLTLAVLGGGLITIGALASILLATGTEGGTQLLVMGLGFSIGFFFVILTDAVLFTEANVVLPTSVLVDRAHVDVLRVLRFWGLAWVGNFLGALLLGALVNLAQTYGADVEQLLAEVVEDKMAHRERGAAGWGQAVLSGALANWLVGLAAFFAVMGRTVVGRYIPILLAVTTFVAAGLQHSPANMGYFALIMPTGEGPGWVDALAWNIIPAGIGNVLGGALLLALPLWFALVHRSRRARETEALEGEED